MENLTKQQLILLALFVSFVSSIATGIVTVSLMDQTSAGVVQTITRVVERSIEKTGAETKVDAKQPEVQEEGPQPEAASVSSATAKALRGTVKIYRKVSGIDTSFYVGLGAVISKDGIVVTDKYNMVAQGRYVVIQNEKEFPVVQITNGGNEGLAYLKIGPGDNGGKLSSPVAFADTGRLNLGQNVIQIQSGQSIAVKEGIIESINSSQDTAAAAGSTIETIATNIDARSTPTTSMLFNFAGEFIGIKTANASRNAANLFVPASTVRLSMPEFKLIELTPEPPSQTKSETTEPTASTPSATTAQ